MIEFKALEPEDIEVRVQMVKDNGCSLLLYKNARVDMRMLDEAVGPENWDREHKSINGHLFCTVGIRCELPSGDTTWVYKEDVGTPSDMEPVKGEASDAFKRACFLWGIGRELYTAPFIWVDKGQLQKHEFNHKRSKWTCGDKFHVDRIEIKDGRITDLSIANQHGFIVYQMRSKGKAAPVSNKVTREDANGPQKPSQARFQRIKELKAEAVSLGISGDGIDSWIQATFKGKAKKDLDDNEIKMTEAYLVNIIRDKKELANG